MGKRVSQREKHRFAADFKAWREVMGMTQVEAAEHLGVPSVRTLQNWEIGRTMPTGLALSMVLKVIRR
jgi:DNA-binding transcriptional regulator YiaG